MKNDLLVSVELLTFAVMLRYIYSLLLLLCIPAFISCSGDGQKTVKDMPSKPYARYWWFASEIKKEDVRYNLNWLKENGFGGVELAWVYPLNRFNPKDTTYTPRQEWLSSEWTDIVDYTVRYADSIGLGCDLTFGTLWPFGDSRVEAGQATRRYGDPEWRQVITRSWEHPVSGYVIDHLTPENYFPYFERLLKAFPRPETSVPQSYFIDSWEVETEKLWSEGFGDDFLKRSGYDITPCMDSIYSPGKEMYLYDYMSLLSDKVLRFYRDFDSTLNSAGVRSRGQVSGAPCDLISGYASLDVPEGEAMLFEPEFNTIPASAAHLSGKRIISSETFTCLYGWPGDFMREEQTADLKLVADALFANGVNHIIWHGKPHNPSGYDTVNFYATTHIGPDCSLAEDIPEFNSYLEKVSSFMRMGETYSDIAVYLPLEDAWCKGIMPKEKQFIWAWGYYEMRYVYFPEELNGYSPTWINYSFLEKATVENGILKAGNAEYKALYIDAEYLDYKLIKRLVELTDEGLRVVIKREPVEPGAVAHSDYSSLVRQLMGSSNVSDRVPGDIIPLLEGRELPPYWCREDDNSLYVFFANPKAAKLKFPLEYGQALNEETKKITLTVNFKGRSYSLDLIFDPYQSLLYKISGKKAEKTDISFLPGKPSVRMRTEGYDAPWLVK